jgi:S-adenosylmethionine decarboxylase
LKELGKHVIVEMYECRSEILDDLEGIREAMLDAAKIAGATIVGEIFHHFSPHGVSGAVVIAESHLSIHTWPEYRYAALDLFTCGESVNPGKAFDHLQKILGSEQISQTEMKRGLFPVKHGESLPFKPGLQ